MSIQNKKELMSILVDLQETNSNIKVDLLLEKNNHSNKHFVVIKECSHNVIKTLLENNFTIQLQEGIGIVVDKF